MAFQFAVLLALAAVARAGVVAPLGGNSVSSRQQDDFGNYAFNYQVTDGLGATNGRWEAGNALGGVVGSYNLADIDGRARRVDYVADAAGFRANVHTNEPGTAASLPAAAVVASPYAGPVAVGPVAHGAVVTKTAFAAAAPVVAAPAPVVAAAAPVVAAAAPVVAAAAPVVAAAAPVITKTSFAAPAYAAGYYGAGLYGAGLYGTGLYGAGLYGAGLYGAGHYGAGFPAAGLYGAGLVHEHGLGYGYAKSIHY